MGRAKVKSAKRKVTEKKDVKEKTEMEEGSGDNVLESGDPATKPTELIDNKGLRKGKRAKKTAKEGSSFPKPKEEPEYFTEKRNLVCDNANSGFQLDTKLGFYWASTGVL